jgi:branched-chain amino acid transport system ATP-binding protein
MQIYAEMKEQRSPKQQRPEQPQQHTGASQHTGPLLQALGLSKRFGGTLAVDDVSLTVMPGTIVGLVGPNGAGKTTLFDMLAGVAPPTAGRIVLNGQEQQHRSAHTRPAQGLVRTFQIPRPFNTLTLLDNVLLGRQQQRGERLLATLWARRRSAREESAARERAYELLEFVELAPLAEQPAGVLSGGQRKLLELARVLMAHPRIILLDEPAAGVNPQLLEKLIDRIARLNQAGTSFLIIEHNMDLIVRLCRHVLVMAAGRLLCEGEARTVLRDPRVIDAYLGSTTP